MGQDAWLIAKEQFWSPAMLSLRKSSDICTQYSNIQTHSCFLARNALYHGLRALSIPAGSEILVPAYICRAAIDPLLAYGAEVVFYSINEDCSPDIADLERKVSDRTCAILIVHYFGFPQPMRDMRKFCLKYELKLIEDCAHVLSGEADGEQLGTIGDASVFSWRKFLPMVDGATLVVNAAGPGIGIELEKASALYTLKVVANMLDERLAHASGFIAKISRTSLQMGSAGFRMCAGRHSRELNSAASGPNGVEFDRVSVDRPMSGISEWILRHSDISKIIARRRRNYHTYLSEFADAPGVVSLFAKLPPKVCPWVYPTRISDVSGAHLLLREQGIPAVTWGDVRHPAVPHGLCTISDCFYEELVFLPVHQCLRDDEIRQVAKTVRELCPT